MTSSKVLLRAFCAFSVLVLAASFAYAQYRASIQGVVTDPSGSVVSAATVTLTNHETGQNLTTTTNDSGIYNFSGLPPSTYRLSVEKAGFKTKVLEDVGVIAEQANAVNLQLEVGQATESVTVSGDSTPLIDTETSNLTGTVDAQDIQKLPSFGRDPFQLLQLAPGAFGDGAQGAGGGTNNLPGTTIGGTGGTDGIFKIENGGQISANGARTGENNYTIDGVNTTSVTWGGTSVITPNEDSIKEVRITTDNYDAENGRYRGAQVEIVSQNGTNQYHGSFFFKAHRPGLNAYTKYNGYPGACCGGGSNVRDANRFNDWGGAAGGPILHNRLFAFFAYETLDNNAASAISSGWYETSQFRALAPSGSNAAKFFAFPGAGPNGGTIVDQTCASIGLVEGTNCHFIAGQGLNLGSPLTAPLGTRDAGYTSSASPGTGGNGSGTANNLGTTPDIAFYTGILDPSSSGHMQYNGRLDFNATSKDLIAFSIYYVPSSSTSLNGNGVRLMNRFNSTVTNRAVTGIWDHTFSSNLLNEARVNAAGWLNKDLQDNPSAPFGLPQTTFNATGSISLNGLGVGPFNGFDQWTYAGKDVLTKIHGAHTMKMGGEFTRLLSVDAPFWADRPGYTFNNIWDFLNDAPVLESAQSDPKTGVPSALRKDVRDNIIAFFYQDNFKLRRNLTVTAGLRWDYFGPISEKNGNLATVVFGSGANEFTNLSVRTGGTQFNAQKTNFGPQLGFAWSPTEILGRDFKNRLVFRGGIGIAYNGITQSNTLDTRFNPPFVDNNPTFSCPAGQLDTTKCNLLYIGSFPSSATSPNGYAANPNAILTFGSNNLPLPSCLTPTSTSGCLSLVALPANWPTEYTYHYTFGGEYDLGHQWVASVGYQGSNTRHLLEHYNLYNAVAAQGIPYNPLVGGITYYADDGSARFNALLLELKHVFSQSFSLDTQYRLAHGLDSGSNAYSSSYYPWNLASGFATSDFDVQHAFKMFGIYSPTIFKGSNSWLEKIAGGWSISGILNAHTGFPWSPQYNFENAHDFATGDPVFNFGGPGAGGSSSNSGNQAGLYLPANYNGGFKPNYGSSATVNAGGFFTPPNNSGGTLFPCLFPNPPASLCPAGQQPLGPIPALPGFKRNSFRGPGYFDVDATLSKSFGLPNLKLIGENAKIEFRANFYNLFNKLNLNGNTLQFTGGIQADPNNAHFGESETALGARVIELQARFSF
jgi:Carboxypeptidase regulatory-like domain